MELLDLRLFRRIAQEGSISRAALGMGLAQSAASHRLAALELEVGRPLLVRHRRGVSLTEAGQLFLNHVERSLELLEEGVAAVGALAEGALRISLAGPASLLGYFAPPLLERLASAGHTLTVQDAHSPDVVRLLLDGTIQVGFVLGAPATPGIRQVPIASDPLIAIASPVHPLAGRDELVLADLAGHRLALYRFSWELPSFRLALASALGERPEALTTISPVEAARAMALSGSMITFVPRITAAADLARGRLVELPIRDLPAFAWQVALAYRERKLPDPALVAVLGASREIWGGV